MILFHVVSNRPLVENTGSHVRSPWGQVGPPFSSPSANLGAQESHPCTEGDLVSVVPGESLLLLRPT